MLPTLELVRRRVGVVTGVIATAGLALPFTEVPPPPITQTRRLGWFVLRLFRRVNILQLLKDLRLLPLDYRHWSQRHL
jgi:hypothetical protein